jgi:hypothetical protein
MIKEETMPGAKWANSRRAQAYRYVAANVGKVIHTDKLARALGLPITDEGLVKARRPLYDLINNGDIELERLSGGGAWKVIAVIGDETAPASITGAEPQPEPELVNEEPAPPTVTYEFIGNSQDGHAPIVKDSTGRVFRLVQV